MGTNGASGLKMHLLGSFTSGMIQASSVPVIAVPDEASMLEPKHIVYATDLDNVDNELQELLQGFSEVVIPTTWPAALKSLCLQEKSKAYAADLTTIRFPFMRYANHIRRLQAVKIRRYHCKTYRNG